MCISIRRWIQLANPREKIKRSIQKLQQYYICLKKFRPPPQLTKDLSPLFNVLCYRHPKVQSSIQEYPRCPAACVPYITEIQGGLIVVPFTPPLAIWTRVFTLFLFFSLPPRPSSLQIKLSAIHERWYCLRMHIWENHIRYFSNFWKVWIPIGIHLLGHTYAMLLYHYIVLHLLFVNWW